MSKQTWSAMVQVVQAKQQPPPRARRPSLRPPLRSIREDHYALLQAAGY
jgi:hypothetical protein